MLNVLLRYQEIESNNNHSKSSSLKIRLNLGLFLSQVDLLGAFGDMTTTGTTQTNNNEKDDIDMEVIDRNGSEQFWIDSLTFPVFRSPNTNRSKQ